MLVISKRKLYKYLLSIVLGLAFSQSFAAYTINKYTINSGGSHMTGGSYEMNASIGQVDASATMSQGDYSLNGGFWHQNNDLIYKNGFE